MAILNPALRKMLNAKVPITPVYLLSKEIKVGFIGAANYHDILYDVLFETMPSLEAYVKTDDMNLRKYQAFFSGFYMFLHVNAQEILSHDNDLLSELYQKIRALRLCDTAFENTVYDLGGVRFTIDALTKTDMAIVSERLHDIYEAQMVIINDLGAFDINAPANFEFFIENYVLDAMQFDDAVDYVTNY